MSGKFSKIILNGETLMDVTQDTVASNNLLSGETAHGADGEAVTGSYSVDLQAKTNINPSTSSQTVLPDSGYDGLSSVQINAMPSGTAGTPTAAKSTVSNHSVSVTPSVTNTTGYITGGTVNGTAVSVSASELVSGTKSITENGTGIDVTNYASVDVDVPSETPTSLEIVSDRYTHVYHGTPVVNCSVAGSQYMISPALTIGKLYKVYIECLRDDMSMSYVKSGWIDYTASSTATDVTDYSVRISAYSVISSSSSIISNVWIFDPEETTSYSPVVVRQMDSIYPTPRATKGTVSNHSVAVTPSLNVTTGGYVGASTYTGTVVNVTASELVSGTKSITENGTGIDVTDYASVDVAVPAPVTNIESLAVTPTKNRQVFDGTEIVETFATGTYNNTSQTSGASMYMLEPDNLTIGETYEVYGVCRWNGSIVTISGEWTYEMAGASWSTDIPFTTSDISLTHIRFSGVSGSYLTFVGNQAQLAILAPITFKGKTIDGYLPVTVDPVSASDPSEYIYQDDEGYIVLPGYESKQVKFIDYDGTMLYSFSKEEINSMNSLPPNPSHEGLTAQGWNWSLANIKSYLSDYPDSVINVGQIYVTDDGKTRIYITLDDPDNLSPYLSIGIDGVINVDWGDETESDTMTGANTGTIYNLQHVYSDIGDYIITIEVVYGSFSFYTLSSSYASILVENGFTASMNRRYSRLYSSAITKILIGNNCVLRSNPFLGCDLLQLITIPNSITSIVSYAFTNCSSLKSVTIPDGITSIGSDAFRGCRSLRSISIPDGVTSINNYTFNGCYSLQSVTIPDSVTSIGTNAFYSCYSLRSVVIPDGVTSIDNDAFRQCYSLQSITIPDSVTSMGSNVFYQCTSLQSVTIPDGVASIDTSAFNNCSSLKSITIPDGVTSIGGSAFASCCLPQSIIIPDSVTSIGTGAFLNCSSLQSITIPDGVTSISDSTFANCFSLQLVTIPDGVTSINISAFSACYSLKSITIPDGVTNIGNNAFSNCYSLQSVIIPDSVTSIGSNAFDNCYGVLEYHFKPTIPPTLSGTGGFGSMSGAIIYVPYSSDHSILNAYKTAEYWSTYVSYIQEEPAS